MACMDKKTFQIYHNDQNIVPDGYVEIDEWIAPTIQVLNQKGYLTKFCCSGHSLQESLILTMDGYKKGGRFSNCYIFFEDGITLPFLPPDFVAEHPRKLTIRKNYSIQNASGTQFFERAQNILETMKQLYEWALELPDFESTEQMTEKPETAVEVLDFCNRKIREYRLDMIATDAMYICNGTKIWISVVHGNTLPDYRELMIALVEEFRVSVEIHQCFD